MKSPNRRARRSFTLIELLIVSVVFSVVSLAIYSSFSSGLKIWKRVNAGIGGEDIVLFFERFGGELRSLAPMRDLGFSGADDRVEFAIIGQSRRMEKRVPGKAAYSFDEESGIIRRGFQDYSSLFTGSQGEPRDLLKGVKSAKFSFYGYDREGKRFVWADLWPSGKPPLAVRVELCLQGQDEGTFIRTFTVPVGRKMYD